MKVRFLEDVDISGKYDISKGEVFEAAYESTKDGDFVMIRLPDDSTAMAPEEEVGRAFEVLENM